MEVMNLVKWSKYDAYKASDEGWLGEIPEHWEVLKLKHIFREKRIKHNPELNCGAISFGKVIEKDDEKTPLSTKASYQEVLKGEFLINPLNLNYDLKSLRIALSEIDVVVSSGYIVLQNHERIDKRYFKYLLHRYDVAYMKLLGSGVRQTINFNHISNSILVSPPLTEQTSIATFLDEKTDKIDQAIAQKERLIELLKERKQILIQELVTGKKVWNEATQSWVKPTETIDSGVKWIGEIPKGWEVKRLKNFIANLESGVSVNASESESAKNNEIGVLKTSAVYTYSFDPKENKKVFKSDLKRVECSVKKDTIIISRMNAPDLVGASGYVFESYDNLYLPDRLWQTVFSTTTDFNKRLISFNLLTLGLRHKLTSVSVGSSPSMKNISKNEFLSLKIAIPENLEEQDMIVKSIEINKTLINKNIILNQSQITKLKEYKAVLIDNAVTGKIKVPEV